jgi:hypothetical protein
MYRKKQQNCQKTTKTAASENVVVGAGACKARAIIRSPPAADNIQNHRSTPATIAHDRQWPSRAKTEEIHPSACWPRAEQEAPPRPWLNTTRPEKADDHHGRARDERKLAKSHRSSLTENHK